MFLCCELIASWRLFIHQILQSFSETMAKVTSGDLDFDLEKTMTLNIFTKTRVAFGTFANSVRQSIPGIS